MFKIVLSFWIVQNRCISPATWQISAASSPPGARAVCSGRATGLCPLSTSRVLFWRQTVALVGFLSFRGFAGRRAGRWTDFCHQAERSPSGTPGKIYFRNEDSIFAATMHFRCETYQTYPNFTFCQMLTHLQTFAKLWRACSRLYRSRFCD